MVLYQRAGYQRGFLCPLTHRGLPSSREIVLSLQLGCGEVTLPHSTPRTYTSWPREVLTPQRIEANPCKTLEEVSNSILYTFNNLKSMCELFLI